MPRLRDENFIYELQNLSRRFPEFRKILDPIIEKFKRGKKAHIIQAIEILKRNPWWLLKINMSSLWKLRSKTPTPQIPTRFTRANGPGKAYLDR